MLDIIGGGLLGSIFGGLFRLAPEVFRFFDKKNEREHELAMFKEQAELEKVKGDIRLQELGAERDLVVDAGVMTAFNSAIQSQAEMVKSGAQWVATMSASVRPIVTYIILLAWLFFHLHTVLTTGLGSAETFKLIMTPDFTALVAGTVNFWFLDRTLSKRGL